MKSKNEDKEEKLCVEEEKEKKKTKHMDGKNEERRKNKTKK